jgi:hypothetical protein
LSSPSQATEKPYNMRRQIVHYQPENNINIFLYIKINV